MILGASFDTVEEQLAFAEDQSFPYALLADSSKEAGEAYQAVRTPDMKYHEAGIPRRISYLISPDGMIVKSYDLDVSGDDLAEHASSVLAEIQSNT